MQQIHRTTCCSNATYIEQYNLLMYISMYLPIEPTISLSIYVRTTWLEKHHHASAGLSCAAPVHTSGANGQLKHWPLLASLT